MKHLELNHEVIWNILLNTELQQMKLALQKL